MILQRRSGRQLRRKSKLKLDPERRLAYATSNQIMCHQVLHYLMSMVKFSSVRDWWSTPGTRFFHSLSKNFQLTRSCDLDMTLDGVTWHTVAHLLSTSTSTPNFTEIGQRKISKVTCDFVQVHSHLKQKLGKNIKITKIWPERI